MEDRIEAHAETFGGEGNGLGDEEMVDPFLIEDE